MHSLCRNHVSKIPACYSYRREENSDENMPSKTKLIFAAILRTQTTGISIDVPLLTRFFFNQTKTVVHTLDGYESHNLLLSSFSPPESIYCQTFTAKRLPWDGLDDYYDYEECKNPDAYCFLKLSCRRKNKR